MVFLESNLQFDFSDEHWAHLLKFDETKDFKLVQESVPGTKGIDFSAIHKTNTLVLIEVKNFRGYRIENKPRMMGGENPLWLEVAIKMRDSVSIIVGSARSSTYQNADWAAYLEVLKNQKKQLQVVLWLEQDAPITRQQQYRSVSEEEIFRRQFKRSLKWLTNKVEVIDKSAHPFVDSLSVSYL
jgi:hypothetical protein